MKRITLAVVALLTAMAITTASASASTAACKQLSCVNKHLTALSSRVTTLESQVASLRKRNRTLKACIAEYPVTRYTTYDNYTIPFDSNSDGNYDSYNWYSQQINYLGQTAANDSVSSWVLRDSCAASAYGRPPSP